MSINEKTPIIVGVAQTIQRDIDPAAAKGPIDLMVDVCRATARDAAITDAEFSNVDSLSMVDIITGNYPDAVGLLSERLAINPGDRHKPKAGGNTPQMLINQAAERISLGEIKLALVTGAETLNSLMQAGKNKVAPGWTERDNVPPQPAVGDFVGTAPYEMPYALQFPINAYPIFETAIRANKGRSHEEHGLKIGEMFSKFTEVAAQNPNAWFPVARTAEEIATPTDHNRYVGFPYTKYMNAVIRVDQAAAVLLTSVGEAKRMGIDPAQWVYLIGCADALDHWFVSERDNFHSSPAIRVAGEQALRMAGLQISDIDQFDLYSCFPAAVQIGREALGIAENDPRPLTVTGGLPYHGGPANNYVSHSITTMVERIRANPEIKGMNTALGWYVTKHAMGIYSAEPGVNTNGGWKREAPATYQAEIDALPKTEIETTPNGEATIESYTVMHSQAGPARAVIAGRLENKKRFWAETPNDPDVWNELMTTEGVGRRGKVTAGDKVNTFELKD